VVRQASSIPPGLLRAYRRTTYHAAGVNVRIDEFSPAALLAVLDTHQAVFVTAWNPRSRRMPAGWNHRAQRRLLQHLHRAAALEGHGACGTWHEAHLLVAADPRAIMHLARRFRQRAVVVLRRGRRVRLVLLAS
jgi:hypothetical protein